jgi:hypothetical protein
MERKGSERDYDFLGELVASSPDESKPEVELSYIDELLIQAGHQLRPQERTRILAGIAGRDWRLSWIWYFSHLGAGLPEFATF